MSFEQFLHALRQYEAARKQLGRDFTAQIEELITMTAPSYAAANGLLEDEAVEALTQMAAREYDWSKD